MKGKWEVAILEKSYPSLFKNVAEGKFTFVSSRKNSEEKRKSEPMDIEPWLYPSLVVIVIAMIKKIRERLGAPAFD